MTNRKIAAMLVLAVFAAGWSFAQTDGAQTVDDTKPVIEKEPGKMPANTITVDFGPTIIGAAIGAVGNIIGEPGVSTSGFGIAAQYESQVLYNLGIAGRFAYLGGGLGFAASDQGDGISTDAVLELKLSSFSLEGHARYYPWARTFFLDGMLGYANLTTTFSGEVNVNVNKGGYGGKQKESVSIEASRSYFKLGAKLGWRIDFGRPGGFVFEPSFGYYASIGLGDTLGKQLISGIQEKVGIGGEVDDISDIDEMIGYIEQFIFVGGPRFALSFGWRF